MNDNHERNPRVVAMKAEICQRWERRTEATHKKYNGYLPAYEVGTYRAALHQLGNTYPSILDEILDEMRMPRTGPTTLKP